ncbi:MAG TPA: ankyrin repeat domain-containing protein [Bryobacteraceae bacterium]|jgi:serine/threonine protein kinase/ankyrin repeat protein|nr:ankyrin repeat domain-containing protein [Bryobacteraceae bacterium]
MNPARIGGYEILSELGRGAMGVVYHARDAAIGRPVAIKVIRIDPGTSPQEGAELRQRLIREASVAGKISHPGIVTVYQLGEDGDNVFIAMEFIEGSSLERLLVHNPTLDRAWALDILAQIAVALDYAHKGNVVHRDIKPANILVRADGRVKIADFGIAKLTAGGTTGMTAAGVSVGSPAYMSPEQIQAVEVDGRSDQFALATIAFQMLAGRMPFKGTTAHTLMFQIVTADPFDPQPGDTPVPPNVRAILARALSKKPQDRFPDCASFIQELTNAAGAPGPAPSTSTVIVGPSKPKENKSWMFAPIVGALLTLALAAAGIYYYTHYRCCAPTPSADPAIVATSTPSPTPEPTPAPTPAPTAEPVKPSAAKPAPPKKPPPATAPAVTLLSAATSGKADVVKSLLAGGANVNEKDADGNTPLIIASEAGNLPLAQILVDARASLEARDSQGRAALHHAASAGKTNLVGFLLDSGALVNKQANDGATPLFYAVEFAKMPVVQLLIARRAKLDLADSSGTTPLMIASEGTAYLPNNVPMVEALLTAGAKVDQVDAKGRSALHRASAEPKPEAVRVLLEHHAKPNVRATDGSTPLIQAVTFSRPAVAQALLNHSADVNLADSNGATPLMIAAEIKDPAPIIKILLNHGAKRGLKDSKGRTALQRASESNNEAAVALLK